MQWVERNISGEDTTYTNLYEEGYVAEEPNSVWTDKYCVLADLPEGRLDGSAIDGDYYYSKELTSQQTAFDNLYSEGDFIDLSTFPHVTDDYILWQSNEKITVEGYVNTGRPRPGSRREVQGIIMYDNDYTVEEYGAFSYNEYSIECFDETGTEVGHIGIKVMDSAEMVESYLKYSGYSVWDEVSPTTDIDWELVRADGLQVDGKYLWKEYNDFEPAKKSDFAVFDTDKIYFSKPYLTDSQIKALRTW